MGAQPQGFTPDAQVPASFAPDAGAPASFAPDHLPASFVSDEPSGFLQTAKEAGSAALQAAAGTLLTPIDAIKLAATAGQAAVASRPVQYAITPLPGAAESRDIMAETAARYMEQARPGILEPPAPGGSFIPDTLSQAAAAVRSSIIPLPTGDISKTIVQATVPVAPLDIAGMLASPVIGALRTVLGSEVFAARLPKILGQVAETSGVEVPKGPGSPVSVAERALPGISDPLLQPFLVEKVLPPEESLRIGVSLRQALPYADSIQELAQKVNVPPTIGEALADEVERIKSAAARSGVPGNPLEGATDKGILIERANEYAKQLSQAAAEYPPLLENASPKVIRGLFDSTLRAAVNLSVLSGDKAVDAPVYALLENMAKRLAATEGGIPLKPNAADILKANMLEFNRASSGSDPVIKPIQGDTARETLGNLLEREARPTLESEQALLGLKKSTEATRAVAADAIKSIADGKPITLQAGQQISEAIAQAVGNGEINPVVGAKILGLQSAQGITDAAQMAQFILESKTQFGRGLNAYSQVAKAFAAQFAGNKQVQDILGKVVVEPTAWGKFIEGYRYVDNIRRAAMVSQLATSVRNLLSQGARALIDVLESASSGVMGAATGKIPASQAFDAAVTDVVSTFRAMSKGMRADTDALLERFPVQLAKLIGTPIGDVSIDHRVAAFLNTFNTMQEQFFRRAAFDAHLRTSAAFAGKPIEEMTVKEVGAAVDHALEMTFAQTPVSGPGKAILNLYHEMPFLTALGNPFIRFWMNGMKFVYNFSPIPLFTPSTYAAMANADPRVAFGAFNRAALGTAMVGAGFGADRAGFSGEKWFEVKSGDRRYDTRPYFPLTIPFFMGRILSEVARKGTDALLHYSSEDWAQAFISMKRTDATGIPLLDIIYADSLHGFKDKLTRFVSGYISSFNPGLLTKTPMDILGQFNREERLPRYTKESPILGETIAGIPFLERTLPVRPSPFRSTLEEKEDPLLRQVTGLTYRVKTPIEIEADRLGLRPRDIYAHTGSPEYDRLITEKMGPMLEKALGSLIESRSYLLADDKKKAFEFTLVMDKFKAASRQIVGGERPDLVLQGLAKHFPAFMRPAVEERAKAMAERLKAR